MIIPLRTTVYMAKETDYVPWSAFSNELGFVSAMLQQDPLYGELRVRNGLLCDRQILIYMYHLAG